VGTLLEDLGAYLQAQGYGTTGTSIFGSYMPDAPDSLVVLYEYGGGEPKRTFTGTYHEAPRVQVNVRDTTYASARARAQLIWNALDSVVETTLSGNWYNAITPLQPPFLLERDSKQRSIVTFNVSIDRVHA
jgi:hypothetical protein